MKLNASLIIIIAILLGLLIFRDKEKEIITIPAKTGSFEPQEPIYITRTDTVFKTKWRTATDTIEIVTENPVNDSLALAYQKAQDSLERFKLYLDAIQIRQFENTFENSYLKLTIKGEVQGKLNYIRPQWELKPREIEVPKKRLINLGIQAGYGLTIHGPTPYVGIGGNLNLEEGLRRILK